MHDFCLVHFYNCDSKSVSSGFDLQFLPIHIVSILEIKKDMNDKDIDYLAEFFTVGSSQLEFDTLVQLPKNIQIHNTLLGVGASSFDILIIDWQSAREVDFDQEYSGTLSIASKSILDHLAYKRNKEILCLPVEIVFRL
ncbi:unnamed protein product [Adineta steineri]|uniref:Uncharacterized protein n=1 Tax=Adineta steineri TaxID=433720 RepID=A0A819TE60_9BILA|nr:unnamed protein product [Adineta steineri]